MTNYHMSVSGAQLTDGEREFIFATAAGVESRFGKDTTCVNIGIMWGASLWCLREGAPHAHVIGVDIDLRRNCSNPKDRIWHEDELQNTSLLEAESATYGRVFEQPIHLLMIDGDHHYHQVKADIEAWAPHIVKGGIVMFHDYRPTQHNLDQFPELEGVKRAVDEYFKWNKEWTDRRVGPNSLITFRKT